MSNVKTKTKTKSLSSTASSAKLRWMTTTAMLSAVSIVLYFVAEIPIVPGFPHLKIDFSDVPALISGIIAGPLSAFAVELIKNIIHAMRTSSFGLGETANFLVGVFLVVPITMVYRKLSKKMNAYTAFIIAGCIGCVSIIIGGLLVNAAIYPIYMSLIGKSIASPKMFLAYLWSTVSINAIKALVNIVLVLPLLSMLNKFKMKKESKR